MASLRFLWRQFEELIAGAAFIVVVAAVCWAVLTRYITEQPATWAGEVSAAAFAWVVFLGAAAAFKRGAHISIDLLVANLPRGPRLALAAAVDLVVLVFCGYVTWLAIEFTLDIGMTTPMPSLRIPYAYHYTAAALGFALMTWRHAEASWTRFADERAKG
jgi:TRAP-type C4-dicarboxylate transport system permease small subunit